MPDGSGFAIRVVLNLRAEPAAFVALPPGRDSHSAISALRAAAPDHETVVLETPATADGFHVLLGQAFPYGAPVFDLDSFIMAAGNLHQPRLVILTGAPDDLLGIADRMAVAGAGTRDMTGPWRFVCLVPGPTAARLSVPFRVWPPDWREVPQIAFDEGDVEARRQALGHYLDRRIYWESAGQLDGIAKLRDRVEMQVSLHPGSRQIDDAIDRVFDGSPMPSSTCDALAAIVTDGPPAFWSAATHQDLLPRCDRQFFLALQAVGIAWRPPGMLHGRLTPLAMRALATVPDLATRCGLGLGEAAARLRRARANPQVAQMALLLTAQVEQDLLDALRGLRDWPELCRRAGVQQDLETARHRAACAPGFDATDTLIDYATFGQLARIADAAAGTLRFPLPRERIWAICHLRNRAAHGHGIGWTDLALAVQSVADLAERGGAR